MLLLLEEAMKSFVYELVPWTCPSILSYRMMPWVYKLFIGWSQHKTRTSVVLYPVVLYEESTCVPNRNDFIKWDSKFRKGPTHRWVYSYKNTNVTIYPEIADISRHRLRMAHDKMNSLRSSFVSRGFRTSSHSRGILPILCLLPYVTRRGELNYSSVPNYCILCNWFFRHVFEIMTYKTGTITGKFSTI